MRDGVHGMGSRGSGHPAAFWHPQKIWVWVPIPIPVHHKVCRVSAVRPAATPKSPLGTGLQRPGAELGTPKKKPYQESQKLKNPKKKKPSDPLRIPSSRQAAGLHPAGGCSGRPRGALGQITAKSEADWEHGERGKKIKNYKK